MPAPRGTTTVVTAATDGSGNQSTNTYEIDQTGSGTTPTYDANGNLTSDGTRTFEWDARNQLLAISQGGHRSEFTYDAVRRRVRIVEIEGGTTSTDRRYVWCETAVCEERDAFTGTTSTRFYTQGVQEAGASYFYSQPAVTHPLIGGVYV